ncbi:MAG: CRISPR-associated endoribonuclease Cas6 [Marinoscillum sp.]
MRIRITFNVQNRGGLVPFHHHHHIASFLRKVIEYSDEFESDNFEFFSFSGLKGQTRIGRQGLRYNSRKVTIVISSPNDDFVTNLARAILKEETLTIGELIISPEIADEESSIEFVSEAKFLCISPMVLDKGASGIGELLIIDPASNEYSDRLYELTLARMESFGIDTESIPDVHKFQLIPDLDYIKRMTELNKVFSRTYELKKGDYLNEIRGYTFPFTLFAAPEVLQFIYECGIGLYCSDGFGMLDLANSDPTKRTTTYLTKADLVNA